jgi:dTMP kinase
MVTGKLIGIEGTDGAGKHTQSRLLHNYISDYIGPCELLSFPRYDTETGQAIKIALKSPDTNLLDKIQLFAKDRLAARDEIMNHLESGTHVICDRYISSMIVYGLAEISLTSNEHLDYRREDIIANIKHLELVINKMPILDLQINLLLDPYISRTLMRNRDELDLNETNLELQYKCYQQFIDLQFNNSYDVTKKSVNIHCTDNDRLFSITSIHKSIINKLIESNIF